MFKRLFHTLVRCLPALFKRLPRMFICLIFAVFSLAGIAVASPQQLPVIFYKLSLVLSAGIAGYWLDRWSFPYSRPDGYLKREWRSHGANWPDDKADFEVEQQHMLAFAAAMVRRALIIAGAMLAVGMWL